MNWLKQLSILAVMAALGVTAMSALAGCDTEEPEVPPRAVEPG